MKNMTFDLEGQGQGQIVKKPLQKTVFLVKISTFCAKDYLSKTTDRRNLIFYPNVAQEWVSVGCQKNFDRMPPGELVNF